MVVEEDGTDLMYNSTVCHVKPAFHLQSILKSTGDMIGSHTGGVLCMCAISQPLKYSQPHRALNADAIFLSTQVAY